MSIIYTAKPLPTVKEMLDQSAWATPHRSWQFTGSKISENAPSTVGFDRFFLRKRFQVIMVDSAPVTSGIIVEG